jgi:glutaredoxin-related protein
VEYDVASMAAMNLNFEFVNIKASGVVLSKIIHLGRSG